VAAEGVSQVRNRRGYSFGGHLHLAVSAVNAAAAAVNAVAPAVNAAAAATIAAVFTAASQGEEGEVQRRVRARRVHCRSFGEEGCSVGTSPGHQREAARLFYVNAYVNVHVSNNNNNNNNNNYNDYFKDINVADTLRKGRKRDRTSTTKRLEDKRRHERKGEALKEEQPQEELQRASDRRRTHLGERVEVRRQRCRPAQRLHRQPEHFSCRREVFLAAPRTRVACRGSRELNGSGPGRDRPCGGGHSGGAASRHGRGKAHVCLQDSGRSSSDDGPKRSSQPVASCAQAFFEALPEEQAAVVPQASPRGATAGVRRKGHAVHACVWNGSTQMLFLKLHTLC
jgi:hypothetical protein